MPSWFQSGHKHNSHSISCLINCTATVGAPALTPGTNHNHSAVTSSNFKRQNTVDSATIKENTARINSATAAASGTGRPSAAKSTVSNIPSLDTSGSLFFPLANWSQTTAVVGNSASPKPRGVTKSNTMTGNRSLAAGSVGRRSTISYEAKTASTEKTNAVGGSLADTPRWVANSESYACD
jgi:MAP/microtubule affinity-regulating kinase